MIDKVKLFRNRPHCISKISTWPNDILCTEFFLLYFEYVAFLLKDHCGSYHHVTKFLFHKDNGFLLLLFYY